MTSPKVRWVNRRLQAACISLKTLGFAFLIASCGMVGRSFSSTITGKALLRATCLPNVPFAQKRGTTIDSISVLCRCGSSSELGPVQGAVTSSGRIAFARAVAAKR